MAEGNPHCWGNLKGEKRTPKHGKLDIASQVVMPAISTNYAFLVPWIVLSLPQEALFHQQLAAFILLTALGEAGLLIGRRTLSMLASGGLLFLIVWGKIAGDIYGLNGPDSAVLLFEFIAVIFLMEASNVAVTFNLARKQVDRKTDQVSIAAMMRITSWAGTQLTELAKLSAGAFGLSLALLVIGGLIGVSVNQVALSGLLGLAAVVAILILLTYRREPSLRVTRSC